MAGPVLEAEIYAGAAPQRRAYVEEMLANIAAQQWRQQQFEQQQKQEQARNIAAARSVQPQVAPPPTQQQQPQPMPPGAPSTPSGPPPQGAMGPAQMPQRPPQMMMDPTKPNAVPSPYQMQQIRADIAGKPSAFSPAGGPTTGAAPPGMPPGPPGWQKMPTPSPAPPGPAGMVDRPPAEQPTVLPPSMMTKPIEQIKAEVMKANPNIAEEDIWPVMSAIVDMQGKQQKGKLEEMRIDYESKRIATEAAKQAREDALERLFGGMKPTPEMVNAYFATGDMDKARAMAGDIERKKGTLSLAQTGGGEGGVTEKSVQEVYPRKADGTIDMNADPVGTVGYDKTGRRIVKDNEGKETTLEALRGGTQKQMAGAKIGVTNVVRQNIVKAGVTNSLARLDEIEKKFPNTNTSMFFGQSGDNPATRGIYGAGRSAMSSEQKQADAAWASFVDEAIPVFTGGLRGSDAFRRFLIEQAPGPGDDAKSRKEKMRLIRANIQGTSKAFFNKFAGDPSFWVPGTKPEDVEAVKEGGAEPTQADPLGIRR